MNRETRPLRPSVAAIVIGAALTVVAACAWSATDERAPRTRLPGRWQGTIGLAPETTSVFVDIDTLSGGGWLAEADVPLQGVEDHPLVVTVRGDTVDFMLSRVPGGPVLGGVLDPRDDLIRGLFTQAGTGAPAQMVRTGPPEISAMLREMSSDLDAAFDLTVLSPDARELREHFNAGADRVRLLMLLSPT